MTGMGKEEERMGVGGQEWEGGTGMGEGYRNGKGDRDRSGRTGTGRGYMDGIWRTGMGVGGKEWKLFKTMNFFMN